MISVKLAKPFSGIIIFDSNLILLRYIKYLLKKTKFNKSDLTFKDRNLKE